MLYQSLIVERKSMIQNGKISYKIIIAKKAQKNLTKIPTKIVERIRTKIALLAFDPFIGKKLEGRYSDCYSIRVWPYRIIYSIVKHKLIVEVIEIEHRGRAYRK